MGKKWHVTYYSKQDGSKPVGKYIDDLPYNEQTKTLSFIELLEEEGPNLHRPYADILEDGIHELRIKLNGQKKTA